MKFIIAILLIFNGASAFADAIKFDSNIQISNNGADPVLIAKIDRPTCYLERYSGGYSVNLNTSEWGRFKTYEEASKTINRLRKDGACF